MHTQPERTGDKGIQLICQFEGLKLERYRDAVGLWTIGYGHLILKEEMEKAGGLSIPLKVDIGTGYSWYDAKE